MNFSSFLKQRQLNRNCETIKDHYEELGGHSMLGITLRYFQQISSGKRPAVLAYFNSSLSKSHPDTSPLLEYLEQYLFPAIEKETKSIWDNSNKTQLMFTDEQLRFLIENKSALKVHQRAILFERVPIS